MNYLDSEKLGEFLGTGQNNDNGESLEQFLASYDPNQYQNPSNTVDTLVFTYSEKKGEKKIEKLLLIKRGNHPGIGWWALPGGFVDFKENIDDAARRELKEETGIDGIEVEQLKCYGDYDRDPRTRIITTAFVALIKEESVSVKAGDDAKEALWFHIQDDLLVYEKNSETYNLILQNLESDLRLQAKIQVTQHSEAMLKNRKYTVLERDLICADHSAIILEGFHFIKKILEK